jgi:hypothetical protein
MFLANRHFSEIFTRSFDPILEHTTLVRRHGSVKNWIELELIHKCLIIKTGLSFKKLYSIYFNTRYQ